MKKKLLVVLPIVVVLLAILIIVLIKRTDNKTTGEVVQEAEVAPEPIQEREVDNHDDAFDAVDRQIAEGRDMTPVYPDTFDEEIFDGVYMYSDSDTLSGVNLMNVGLSGDPSDETSAVLSGAINYVYPEAVTIEYSNLKYPFFDDGLTYAFNFNNEIDILFNIQGYIVYYKVLSE